MTDFLYDPDTGMSTSIGEYLHISPDEKPENDKEIVDEVDSATIAIDSLDKSIKSDQP